MMKGKDKGEVGWTKMTPLMRCLFSSHVLVTFDPTRPHDCSQQYTMNMGMIYDE